MRVRLADPVDLFHLAGGQILARVQTPAALQQPLAPQDFVDARDTAVKPVGRVEQRRVDIGNLLGQGQPLPGDRLPAGLGLNLAGVRDARPSPQQPALDPQDAAPDPERSEEVHDNAVVVPRVQRDLRGASGIRHRANHIERLVSVERRDLDGDHVLHLREPQRCRSSSRKPEASFQDSRPTHRRRAHENVRLAGSGLPAGWARWKAGPQGEKPNAAYFAILHMLWGGPPGPRGSPGPAFGNGTNIRPDARRPTRASTAELSGSASEIPISPSRSD